MLEEIIKLREEGLSFRKIASKLNTSVGRVQYRWNKWLSSKDAYYFKNEKTITKEPTESSISQKTLDFVPIKGELQIKLLTPRKMIMFWEASSLSPKIMKCYFNLHFENLVHAARIYDVTDILFNGGNANHYYEVPLSYENGYWMIKGLTANRSYLAHLGVKLTEKEFFPLLQSNVVHTPTIDIPFDNGMNYDLLKFQTYEDKHPKWIEHVSTYSYYQECSASEGKNG